MRRIWLGPALFGALLAPARADTLIGLTYDSVMDMVRPENHPGIRVHHALEIRISGQDLLTEKRNRSTPPYYADQNATVQALSQSPEDDGYVAWRVEKDGRLVRVQNDPQSTRTMTVTLLPDHTCRLDVTDQLKPGFTEYAFLRISTHKIGYFSSYRVVATSCTIR